MRHLFLAAVGVLAVSGAVSAQQPQYRPAPQYPVSPAAAAATPIRPVSGTTVIGGGPGCTNCGTAVGPVARGGFTMSGVAGGNCAYGSACNSGCGSLRSDLGFHFGSCKSFFAPCGPTPMAAPWGQGFACPRAYDSYANH